MRILVTGGGLLGGAIVRAVPGDHDVTIFDRVEPADTNGAAFIEGDVRDPVAIGEACNGADVVIHTAALHHVHYVSFTDTDFVDINVTGTWNALAAARAAGVRRFVFSSSTAVFADSLRTALKPVTLTDDFPVAARDGYGLTKVIGEQMLEFSRRVHGLETVALRYGAIWQLVRQVDRVDVQAVFGGRPDPVALALGQCTDLRDAAAANVAAALHPGPIPKPAYNVVAATPAEPPAGVDVPPPTVFAGEPAIERDLGMRIAFGRDDFLRDALTIT